jgi:hypothetical protein
MLLHLKNSHGLTHGSFCFRDVKNNIFSREKSINKCDTEENLSRLNKVHGG